MKAGMHYLFFTAGWFCFHEQQTIGPSHMGPGRSLHSGLNEKNSVMLCFGASCENRPQSRPAVSNLMLTTKRKKKPAASLVFVYCSL